MLRFLVNVKDSNYILFCFLLTATLSRYRPPKCHPPKNGRTWPPPLRTSPYLSPWPSPSSPPPWLNKCQRFVAHWQYHFFQVFGKAESWYHEFPFATSVFLIAPIVDWYKLTIQKTNGQPMTQPKPMGTTQIVQPKPGTIMASMPPLSQSKPGVGMGVHPLQSPHQGVSMHHPPQRPSSQARPSSQPSAYPQIQPTPNGRLVPAVFSVSIWNKALNSKSTFASFLSSVFYPSAARQNTAPSLKSLTKSTSGDKILQGDKVCDYHVCPFFLNNAPHL